jgi:phage terminase large subunit
VINHKTEECDAVYRSQVAPDEFITDAFNIGKFFNWALMGIESNKDGLWVNDGLDKLGYINLYYRKVFDDITKLVTKFFGWKTTSSTRPFCLAALKAVFLRKVSGFPAALLTEMITFLRNAKGRPEALAGKNDDVVMAAAIGYAILQEQGKWVDTSSNREGFSMSKAIFGDD